MNIYGYINQDRGYRTMYENKTVDRLLPYVPNIEPRIIQFLRTLYYYKQNAITPCIPLYMEYQINNEDWDVIVFYIKKYKIKAFNK